MKTTFTSLLVLLALLVFGQPGTLDIDFDADGKVTTDFWGENDRGQSVSIQPDGKILVAGYSEDNGTNDFALVRYHTDGSLEYKVVTNFQTNSSIGHSVAIQPDGKILVAGFLFHPISISKFALVRYKTGGLLDSTFGIDGRVTTDFHGGSDVGRSVAIQLDGNILVAGQSDNGTDIDFALARYLTGGSLDSTFSVNGKVTTDFGSVDDFGWSVAVQPDGKILVAGQSDNGTDDDFALVRYNMDGSLDNTFGVNGKVTTDIGNDTDFGRSVAIQQDGKIIIAGSSRTGTGYDFALVRYSADGTLDNTFGTSGTVTTDIGNGNDRSISAVIQPDGKILAAGFSDNGPNNDFALVRYNVDGSLDSTFGVNGKVTTDFGNDDDIGHSVALQPDGKIVVAGESKSLSSRDFAVARYLSGLVVGIIDFSFENQTALIYPNPIRSQAILEYTLIQEEKISIRLVDISGKVIKTFVDQQSRSEGEHKEVLDFPNVAPGNYLLVIDNVEGSQSIKVIVQ